MHPVISKFNACFVVFLSIRISLSFHHYAKYAGNRLLGGISLVIGPFSPLQSVQENTMTVPILNISTVIVAYIVYGLTQSRLPAGPAKSRNQGFFVG